MKIKEIHLHNIEKHLMPCLVEVDYEFLKSIIIEIANDKEPYKNKIFVNRLGLRFNENARRNMGLYSLFRNNRAINFSTLKSIKELSNYDWSIFEKNIMSIRVGRHKGKANIKYPIKIDKKMGLIIGHILGDGSIDSRFNQIFYTNKNKDLILEFYNLMKELFGIKSRIWVQKSGNFKEKSKWIKRIHHIDEIEDNTQIGLFYPSICGLILNSIFNDFAIGKDKRITKTMLNSSKDFKIGLIRAFFDDEGHMDKERGPRFYQDNKEILEKIKLMLSDLNIGSYPIRNYLRRDKSRYFFNINHRINYFEYYKIIGCTSKKKQEALENLINKNTPIKNSK